MHSDLRWLEETSHFRWAFCERVGSSDGIEVVSLPLCLQRSLSCELRAENDGQLQT